MCSGFVATRHAVSHCIQWAQGTRGWRGHMAGLEKSAQERSGNWKHTDASHYTNFKAAKGTFVFKPVTIKHTWLHF